MSESSTALLCCTKLICSIAGIDWVIKEAVKNRKRTKKRSVINLSLSGPSHPGLDAMVKAALKRNIPVTIAAGNTGDNARAYSPGRVKAALTAGAIDKRYQYWHLSARGKGVDLLAPGVDVLSTWITSNVATTTLSGSSMSAPQIAGLVAYHLSLYPLLSVKRINHRLKRKSSKGLIKNNPPGMKKIGVIFNCWNEGCYPAKNVTVPPNVTTTSTTMAETTTTEIVTATVSEPPPEPTPEPPPPPPPEPAPEPAPAAAAAQAYGEPIPQVGGKAKFTPPKAQAPISSSGPKQTPAAKARHSSPAYSAFIPRPTALTPEDVFRQAAPGDAAVEIYPVEEAGIDIPDTAQVAPSMRPGRSTNPSASTDLQKLLLASSDDAAV